MSYRIELSTTNRAGCTDKACKDEKLKIQKGEIRFGTWVTLPGDHSSWKWKHWGCVSGSQLSGIRDKIEKDDGTVDYDMIDGYDELNDHPDVQEKIRRCIDQGHIDLEDFNGDPEWCVPGKRGIRGRAGAKKKGGDDDEDAGASSPVKKTPKKAAATPKKTPKGKKGAKAADDDGDDVASDEEKQTKPKSAKAAKTGKATKKAIKAEESELDDAKPVKNGKSAKGKKAARDIKAEAEDEDAAEEKPKAVKNGKAAKGSKAVQSGVLPEPSSKAEDGDNQTAKPVKAGNKRKSFAEPTEGTRRSKRNKSD